MLTNKIADPEDDAQLSLAFVRVLSQLTEMRRLWERDCALSARLIGLRFIWYSCTLIPSIVLYAWFVLRVALQFVFRFLTPSTLIPFASPLMIIS